MTIRLPLLVLATTVTAHFSVAFAVENNATSSPKSVPLLAAAKREEPVEGQFHDDLLEHLVGAWNVSGIAHGTAGDSILEASWVLNHQYLRIHQKGVGNGPFLNVPFEAVYYIGYNHAKNRYVASLMTVFGGDQGVDYLMYGERLGDEIKLVFKGDPATAGVQRFIWDRKSKSWRILSSMVEGEKELEPHVVLTAVTAKTPAQ